jgi:enoyl-CoA hydratase
MTLSAKSIPGYKAGTWIVDPSHSEVSFSVRHLMISKVRGKFGSFSATILKAPQTGMALAKRSIDEGLERDPRGALATELMAIEESLAAAEWRKTMSGFGS